MTEACVCYGMDGQRHDRGSVGCIWEGITKDLWHKSHVEAVDLHAQRQQAFKTIEVSNMAKKPNNTTEEITMTVAKVSNKLAKVNENFSINMYDNGYMVEVGGRDKKDDWKTSKIMVSTDEELIAVIKEVISMTRAD